METIKFVLSSSQILNGEWIILFVYLSCKALPPLRTHVTHSSYNGYYYASALGLLRVKQTDFGAWKPLFVPLPPWNTSQPRTRFHPRPNKQPSHVRKTRVRARHPSERAWPNPPTPRREYCLMWLHLIFLDPRGGCGARVLSGKMYVCSTYRIMVISMKIAFKFMYYVSCVLFYKMCWLSEFWFKAYIYFGIEEKQIRSLLRKNLLWR